MSIEDGATPGEEYLKTSQESNSASAELHFPAEVDAAINLVQDPAARAALEAHRDAVLEYVAKMDSVPAEEIDALKEPVRQAMDAVQAFEKVPGVGDAVMAIVFGEMALHKG